MTLGLLGRKKGMTQIFGKSGEVIPVTVIEAGPCRVVGRKSNKPDGYDALLLGFERAKQAKGLNKAMSGFFAKRNLDPYLHLREFRAEGLGVLAVGSELKVDAFQVGDLVNVKGVTKGRGFQGVIKRHGEHGGPDAHGAKRFHRRPGSIGQNSWPSRVFKKMRMPGQMGGNQVLTRHLQVVGVLPEQNLLLVRGAVPGSRGGVVIVYHCQKDFLERLKKTNDRKEANKDAKEGQGTQGESQGE